MNNVLRVAIVDPSDSPRESLRKVFLGIDSVWLEAECSRYEFFVDVAGQTNPDISVVALDHDPEKGLLLIGELRENLPECSVLAVSSSTDGQFILRAMRAGAKEFLTQPVKFEDLVGVLDRLSQLRFGSGAAKPRACTVIVVVGASGGVGSTSLAVNLGCILAASEDNSVALIDLDLCLGDADVFLDTTPDYTLVDVAQNVTRLDFELLRRSLIKHSSGLYLLPRPVQLQDTSLIAPDDLQRVMGLLQATFSHLIVDLSKSFTSVDMVALEMADHVLLVMQLDLPCLRNVVRLRMSFGEIESLKQEGQDHCESRRDGKWPNQPEESPGNDRRRSLLADQQRLSRDGRGSQQRGASHRTGPQGEHHAVARTPDRGAVRRRFAARLHQRQHGRLARRPLVEQVQERQQELSDVGRPHFARCGMRNHVGPVGERVFPRRDPRWPFALV